ncbi:MAG: AAA family ATPase [Deltaproteobacteria bacterium]|nr:AAA family ATPase [Deltaproteobacteria bacterium]
MAPSSQRKIWLGRQHELDELVGGVDEVMAGRGGLYLVTGEPGIGKTRLCDEIARGAAARGLAVHWGRAWEAGGAPSYWPCVQVLRSMCRGLDPELLNQLAGIHGRELAELMPELRQRLPGLEAAHPSTGRDRFQLFEAVNAFMHAVAARAPQLMVLDDLHAADPSSLLLLHFLVRDLRAGPLLVVGTYRDAEARLAPDVGRTLAQVAREATLLPLGRLARDEVGEYVAQATGARPSPERVEELHQRSEGNPLFLRELLRLQGATARQPEGIREVVRARLALLTPALRHMLEAAAVLGREFEVDVLVSVAAIPEQELSALLLLAADAGIVEPLEPTGRWRFTHVLLREGLYDDLSTDRRAVLHRAAAAELGRLAGGTRLSEVAHHMLRAIPAIRASEAADVALRAAEVAMELLAFEDASQLLMRTKRQLDGVLGEERRLFDVLLALGIAQIRSGEVTAGKSTCLRGAQLARRLGDWELFARAVLGSTYEFAPGVRDETLIAMLGEALAGLPAGDGALRARCMAQLAAERQPELDTEPPLELARAAVAMARRVGGTDTLRSTLSSASMAMLIYGEPVERMSLNREALSLALAAGDKRVALRAHLFLTGDHWEQGDRVGAEAHGRAYEALDQASQHSRFQWVPLGFRGANALWDGRFDEAERHFRAAAAGMQEDEARGVSMVATPLGFGRAAERYHDLPGVEARLRAGFAALPGELAGCLVEMLVAQLHGRVGDRGRSARQLATVRALPVFAAIKEPSWLSLLTEACHLLGDVALAEQLYAAMLPRAHRFVHLGPMGPYSEPPYTRQLGLMAQTLGRLDDAVRHLSDAEARVVEVGMRSHLARLRFELAGVLLARGAEGDRARAAGLLEQARVVATELGQAALLPLLDARAAETGPATASVAAPTPTPTPTPARLGVAPTFAMCREGDYWTITCGPRTLRLKDSRGLQVLAQLVSNVGQEFHVLQLVSPADEAGDSGDAGTVLDAQAVQSYRGRLLELREELEEAERFADRGRADRAREEIEVLTQELARAVGLGGRARRSGGAAERARTAVQKRVRGAIQRIIEELPELGRHLDHTVRTGAFCGYLPDGRPGGRRS